MTLFKDQQVENILPYDGVVIYFGKVFDSKASQFYLERLLSNIGWRNDEAVMFGKHIITKRKVAWYGDTKYEYTYSNITKQALPWTEELHYLKKITEDITGNKFNSCLLNLYHTGEEGMALA